VRTFVPGVFFVKWVAVLTLYLIGIFCLERKSTHHIFTMGDSLKVVWMHAAPDAAQMIGFHVWRNFTTMKEIRKAVSLH
jgi:hypothetical protein